MTPKRLRRAEQQRASFSLPLLVAESDSTAMNATIYSNHRECGSNVIYVKELPSPNSKVMVTVRGIAL